MKKTINGVEYESFEEGKNAEQLGIDTARKFIVVEETNDFSVGDIVRLKEDDGTNLPYFVRIGENDKIAPPLRWKRLAYYDEPKFKVGDKVRIKSKSVGCPIEDSFSKENREQFINRIEHDIKINHKLYGEVVTLKGDYFLPEDLELVEDSEFKERYSQLLNSLSIVDCSYHPNLTVPRTLGEGMVEFTTGSTTSTSIGTSTGTTTDGRVSFIQTPRHENYLYQMLQGVAFNKEEVKLNKPKFMSIITNAFKSKENKALEHFNLGTTDKLNENGRNEFVDLMYETGVEVKKEFLKRIVSAYNEESK